MKFNQLTSPILFSSLLLLSLLAWPSSTQACSCAGPAKPCVAFGQASAVFIGKVTGGAKQEKWKDQSGQEAFYVGGTIHFAVETIFSGPNQKTIDIHSGTGGGDCGYFFKLGEVYLIYAYGDQKTGFSTNICTRTRPFSQAAEDLSFLENLPTPGVGARISGMVYRIIDYKDQDRIRRSEGLPGITITAKNAQGQVLKTKTDDEGKYEFKALKPDTYEIDAELSKEYDRDSYFKQKLTVSDRGCGEASFAAVMDGRISGQVLDNEDRPVANIEVVLIRADDQEPARPNRYANSDYADEKGRFEIGQVQPGRYRLGINVNRNPDAEHPYPSTWYPGVAEKLQATIVEVGTAEKVKELAFKLPAKLTQRTIKGAVYWLDGKPVPKADIYLESEAYPGWCVNGCGHADEQGQFILKGYDGTKYRIKTKAPINPTAPYKDQTFIHAEPVWVELKADLENVRIILTLDQKTFDERYGKKKDQ